MKKLLMMFAALALLFSVTSSAYALTAKVRYVQVRESYSEVRLDSGSAVCAGLTGSWPFKVRFRQSDENYDAWHSMLTAAWLSGKDVTLLGKVVNNRCHVTRVQLGP